MAQELASATGESITGAVGSALEAKLQALRRHQQRAGMADRLMELGRRAAAHAPADWLAKDFDAELYDERGLPR